MTSQSIALRDRGERSTPSHGREYDRSFDHGGLPSLRDEHASGLAPAPPEPVRVRVWYRWSAAVECRSAPERSYCSRALQRGSFGPAYGRELQQDRRRLTDERRTRPAPRRGYTHGGNYSANFLDRCCPLGAQRY